MISFFNLESIRLKDIPLTYYQVKSKQSDYLLTMILTQSINEEFQREKLVYLIIYG